MATSTPKRWKRIPSTDFSTAEEVLKAAACLMVPEDQTQHQALVRLMPYLYVLKNKGCNFSQLATLLAECGFNLQPSMVRDYYYTALATRMDICQERMNEQILLMAEIRKENKGVDVSSITERVAAIMEKQRTAAASKIDNLFGGSSATPVAQTSAAGSNEAAKPLLVENKHSGLRPAPENSSSAEIVLPSVPSDDSGSFGLLNLKPVAKKAASKAPAFFSQDDSTPVIPDLQISKTASENKNSGLRPAPAFPPPESKSQNITSPANGLRCLALKDGPQPLKKRENVPSEIYLPGDLEHPKIPGLMLSLDDRLYSAALEYADENGEIKIETLDEKRFRVLWKHPHVMTPTMTGGSFTKMDESLFKKQ